MKPISLHLALLLLAVPAASPAQRSRPFEITDNSLLVEEAFNQEAGIFQNIFLFQRARAGAGWGLEFTQEWPVRSQRHQISFTLPFELNDPALGNILVNYRLQARMEDENGPAFSPRLSLVLPTGADHDAGWGVQLNLPVSRQFGDLYAHVNAGLTASQWRASLSGLPGSETIGLLAPHASGSVIYRVRPMLHFLLESVLRYEEQPAPLCCTTSYESTLVLSPGFRVGKSLGDQQLVLGAGVPIDVVGSAAPSLLLYLSYELPFRAVK